MTSSTTLDFQTPLISTSATTAPSSAKLMAPSKPSVAPCRAWGHAGVALRRWKYQLSMQEEQRQQHADQEQRFRGRCGAASRKVHALRKPRNSGGSPSGVSEPPALETMKMKNTTTWALWRRLSLARISGRISSMDAPVVPMKLASTAPIARMAGVEHRAAVQVAADVDAARRR